jgi:NADP-dependent 3-hydroxy acid dehydrogenase YdfG
MASKVFIVTGASKGLGAAIVQHLLAQSHKVVVTARSESPLQKLKEAHPTQVEYVAGDITSEDASYNFFQVLSVFFFLQFFTYSFLHQVSNKSSRLLRG